METVQQNIYSSIFCPDCQLTGQEIFFSEAIIGNFRKPDREKLKLCLKGEFLWASPVGLEEEEEPEIKLPTFAGSYRKLGNSKNKKQNLLPLFH